MTTNSNVSQSKALAIFFLLSTICGTCTSFLAPSHSSIDGSTRATSQPSRIVRSLGTSTPEGSEGGRRQFLEDASKLAFLSTSVLISPLDKPNDAVAATMSSSTPLPSVGAKAPDFNLPNSRGEGTTSLKSLISNGKDKKKWTVLYFYPAAFTSGCTLEARGFQRDIEKYRELGAQIVGVSVDPVEKNAQFCSSEGLDFYMLSDTGGIVSKLYGSAVAVPGFGTFSNRQTYIIDPKGDIRWVFTDVESRVARHSAEVLDKLGELEQAKA